MIRGLLLDLDDTLVDRGAALAAWLAVWLPAAAPDDVSALVAIDRGGRAPRQALLAAVAARAGASIAAVRTSFLRDFPRRVRLRPDADALLCEFRGATAIVSNGPPALQRAKLTAAGLTGRVDHVLISGEVGPRKPAPAIFQLALARLGCARDEALVVGDDPDTDLAGARGAGIAAVLVRSPWATAPAGARCVDRLTELAW